MQQAETMAAVQDIDFLQNGKAGNMIAYPTKDTGIIKVVGVDFNKKSSKFIASLSGKGELSVKIDSPQGETIANISADSSKAREYAVASKQVKGIHNLFFIIKGKELTFDEWMFK